MKIKSPYLIVIAVMFFACTKKEATPIYGFDVANAETVKSIPLNDLGAFTYKDSIGGLYPGGTNEAPAAYAADLLYTAGSIIPIDTFGNPSTKNGKVVFISMGGSTGGHNMQALKLKTTNNPLT